MMPVADLRSKQRVLASGQVLGGELMNPTTGNASGCCARAAIGHAAVLASPV